MDGTEQEVIMKKIIVVFVVIISLWTAPLSHVQSGLLIGNGYQGITRAYAAERILDSEEDIVAALRQGLLKHKKKIVIHYIDFIDKYDIVIDKLVEQAIATDAADTAKDGDYLAFSLTQWKASIETKAYVATLTFLPTYKTTAEEEQAVDKKVKSVLKSLKLENASDYKKVKAIHDYIIKRVNYDDSLTRTSAYHALIEKSAVCEGYIMLAYRMFTEAGLECRIITGTGNGGAHGWNIVKVKDKWYNIDLTWDDPVASDGTPRLVYDYFLKSTKDFKGHKRDEKYTTEEFVKAYPISKTSYKRK